MGRIDHRAAFSPSNATDAKLGGKRSDSLLAVEIQGSFPLNRNAPARWFESGTPPAMSKEDDGAHRQEGFRHGLGGPPTG
jgi:hypothetical protein